VGVIIIGIQSTLEDAVAVAATARVRTRGTRCYIGDPGRQLHISRAPTRLCTAAKSEDYLCQLDEVEGSRISHLLIRVNNCSVLTSFQLQLVTVAATSH